MPLKQKQLPIAEECRADQWIPGNLHSLKHMTCDICKKKATMAGSSYIAGYEICRCCVIKIQNHKKLLDMNTLPDIFFQNINNKSIFNYNKWYIAEIKRRIEQPNIKRYLFQANRRTISHGIVQYSVEAESKAQAKRLFYTGHRTEVDSHIDSTWNDDTKAEIINTD